jgi:hypothetical protein
MWFDVIFVLTQPLGQRARREASRRTRRLCILSILVVSCLQLQVASEVVAEDTTPEAKNGKEAKGAATALVEDPRGNSDLTVCSQNLKLFGTLETLKQKVPGYSADEYKLKVESLVRRFASTGCDVIAVQEILGRNQDAVDAGLQELAGKLQRSTNRVFRIRAAPPAEGGMTLGFLVAEDRAAIVNTLSYAKIELPKLAPKQKPRLFSRTPLEIQLIANSRETNLAKPISIVNFHFKSKRGGEGDPTGLEWETYRMEMSEAIRRVAERRHRQAFARGDSILMLLGDRNSNFDVASARILDGTLNLSSFQADGDCRLSKRGVPLCKAGSSMPQRLFSVLTSNKSVFVLPGTFSYKGEYSWLDDILMPAESLPFAWKSAFSESQYDSGVVYSPKDASDHALVYVKLNW